MIDMFRKRTDHANTDMWKELNRFEKGYLLIGLAINLVIAFMTKSSFLSILCSICSIFNAVYAAKGKISSYLFGFVATGTYIYIAYAQRYYSEMIVNLVILAITIYGFFNWLKHRDEDHTIIIHRTSRKELLLSILSQVMMFYVYYKIFSYFNNKLILVSTINLCFTILGFYYNARMSKLTFIILIIGGIFKSILWIDPILKGDLANVPILISCLLYLVGDFYGYLNWSKMEKLQKEVLKTS